MHDLITNVWLGTSPSPTSPIREFISIFHLMKQLKLIITPFLRKGLSFQESFAQLPFEKNIGFYFSIPFKKYEN